jgi:hypothetical protein
MFAYQRVSEHIAIVAGILSKIIVIIVIVSTALSSAL